MDHRVRSEQLIDVCAHAAALLVGAGALSWMTLGAAPSAWAEPFLAVRAGAKCADCHTNLTGGGKRTAFATVHAHEILMDLDLLPIPKRTEPFSGELTDHVSIGADFRARWTGIFTDDPDEAGRVPNNTAFRSNLESSSFDVQEALGYLEVDLWPDVLDFYLDLQFAPGGVTSREIFGLVQNALPYTLYIKGGQFFPPFGLRIFDDTSFVRTNTGFTFDNPDTGVEVGLMPGPFFFSVSVTDGIKGDKDVLTSLNGYFLFQDVPYLRNAMIGGSFARQSSERSVGGFYIGGNFWNFTYLGELDFIDDNTDVRPRAELAAYSELDLLLFNWLNVRGTMDYVQIEGDNAQNRFGVGLEPFINRFLQLSLVYRVANAPPTNLAGNRDELFFEFHVFF
jgi:hypothetical protein